MIKLATTFIAATLTLAVPARALDVGDVIKPHQGAYPAVGCTEFADAQEALRLFTRYGAPAAQAFATRIFEEAMRSDDFSARACLAISPRDEARIVRKHRTQYTAPEDAWFCITSTGPDYKVGPPADREKPAKPVPCFWVFWSGRAGGR
jgi:hypothetical protein